MTSHDETEYVSIQFNALQNGELFAMHYERHGTIAVPEQLTSWVRECAIAFYKHVNSR